MRLIAGPFLRGGLSHRVVVIPGAYCGLMLKRLGPLLALLIGACAPMGGGTMLDVQAPATWSLEPGGFERATIVRVVDGDTVVARVDAITPGPGAGQVSVGEEYSVRLIGIDTPETVKPGTPVECFGKEASRATTDLLEGAAVRMVMDVYDRDRYDRLLRYIYMDQEMANARLVVNGYASAYTYPPDVRHADLFVRLQREARENVRGLWSPDTCSGEH